MDFKIDYTGINLDKILLIIHDLCVTDSVVTIDFINPTVSGTHAIVGVYHFNCMYYRELIKKLQEFNKADEDIYVCPSDYTVVRTNIKGDENEIC